MGSDNLNSLQINEDIILGNNTNIASIIEDTLKLIQRNGRVDTSDVSQINLSAVERCINIFLNSFISLGKIVVEESSGSFVVLNIRIIFPANKLICSYIISELPLMSFDQ